MPEQITITNYTTGPVAHPGLPAIQPGETKSRPMRSNDFDSVDPATYERWAAAGLVVQFDDIVPPGVTEVSGASTVAPDQRVIIATDAGFAVTLPKLADVPVGHSVTIVRREGTGDLTVEGDGSETVGGQPNQVLSTDGQRLRVVAEGPTNWGLA
jgi:hypothetical protein